MASRVKEDDKNERIIRGLLKLPANRRCINCNSLGPQYVCTNFATFICTNCSGIHREFTHRVKSISMAKFTSQEVSALQEGGNERAKEIYFKEWDQHRHSFPDSSNIDRLREFIRHVYVDRRFAGERSYDRPPRVKGDTEDLHDKRKVDFYRGSKSSSFDDADGRQYGERPGSASPTFDYRSSPGRVDRDDKSGHISQDRNTATQQPDVLRREERSSSEQKDVDTSKSSMPQPVRAVSIAPPAPVGEPAKPSGLQLPHNSASVQNTASPSGRGSSIGNSVEMKVVTSRSLIDFDADPVLPVAGSLDQSVHQQNTPLPAENGGWASFDDSSSVKKTQVASAVCTLDSMLSQLSVPQNASAANTPSISAAGIVSFRSQSNAMHWPTIQQNQSFLFQAPNVQPSNLSFSTANAGTPDYQVPPQASTSVYGPATVLSGQTSQGVTKPLHEANVEVSLQPTADAKPSGRKELPADLFTMTFAPQLAPFPYYNTSQHPMGYGMQYPSAVAMPTYSLPPASANPFAFSDERKLVHSSTFPNLSPLQGALPNVDNHPSILRTTSLPTQQWFPQQQFPVSAVPQMQSSGLYAVQQGASPMPQHPPNPMYAGTHQKPQITTGVAHNFSGNEHLDSRNYRPHTPNSFAPGGNPFG